MTLYIIVEFVGRVTPSEVTMICKIISVIGISIVPNHPGDQGQDQGQGQDGLSLDLAPEIAGAPEVDLQGT